METMIVSAAFWRICVILSGVRICGNIYMELGNKYGIVFGESKTKKDIDRFLSANLTT
jgi:hypothetical protein